MPWGMAAPGKPFPPLPPLAPDAVPMKRLTRSTREVALLSVAVAEQQTNNKVKILRIFHVQSGVRG